MKYTVVLDANPVHNNKKGWIVKDNKSLGTAIYFSDSFWLLSFLGGSIIKVNVSDILFCSEKEYDQQRT